MNRESITARKVCTYCDFERPIIDFDRDSSKADGYKDVCKACRKIKRENDERSEMDERIQQIDSAAMKLLEQVASKPRATLEVPHLATLLEDMVSVFGGSRGLATHILKEFLAAKPGSQTRQRYLQMLEKATHEASVQGYVDKPLDKLTDDELEKLNKEKQKRLMAKLGVVSKDDADSDGREPAEAG